MALSTSRGRAAGSMTQSGREGAEFARPRARVAFDAETPAGVDPDALWRKQNSTQFRRIGSTAAQREGRDPNYTPGYGASAPGNSRSGFTPRADWEDAFKPRGFEAGEEVPTNPKSGLDDQLVAHGGHPFHSWDAEYSGRRSMPNGGQPVAPVLPPAATPAAPASPGDLTQLSDPSFNQTAQPPATPGFTEAQMKDWSAERRASYSPSAPPPALPSVGMTQSNSAPGLYPQATRREITGLPAGQSARSHFIPGQNSPANLSRRKAPPIDPLS